MSTGTQRALGRKALAYYRGKNADASLASPVDVGEMAVAALEAGHSVSLPLAVRLKLTLNALWPALIARQIAKRWRAKPHNE